MTPTAFLPIHIYEATTGELVAAILRPGKTPSGTEVRVFLKHIVRRIRANWPRVEILIRGVSHYCRPEVMAWCEVNGGSYIFGLGGNATLHAMVSELTEDVAVRRADKDDDAKVRRFGDLRYAAGSWAKPRRVIARIEASAQGVDRRFVVTNLPGRQKTLYDRVYCARGRAENLIKALHRKRHDRSCRHPGITGRGAVIFSLMNGSG